MQQTTTAPININLLIFNSVSSVADSYKLIINIVSRLHASDYLPVNQYSLHDVKLPVCKGFFFDVK